jgi:hypothetical protein
MERGRNPVSIDFLRTEVGTAFLFARIASEAKDKEKRLRNVRHARTGYDTLVYFLSQLPLTIGEHEEIRNEVLELRRQLSNLGEEF